MAVYECPECGRNVSDQARTCPHCGINIYTCYECGGVVKYGVDSCPHCGATFSWEQSDDSIQKEEEPKTNKDEVNGCLGSFVILAIIMFAVNYCGGSTDSSSENDTTIVQKASNEGETTDPDAYDKAGVNLVVSHLNAPSTAKLLSWIPKKSARQQIATSATYKHQYSKDLDFEQFRIEAENGLGGRVSAYYVVAYWKGKPVWFDEATFNDFFDTPGGIDNLTLLLKYNCNLEEDQLELKPVGSDD